MTNPPLTDAPLPDVNDPLGLNAFHTANRTDDDGQALDDYFESAYQGPPVESESAQYEALSIPTTTRLIARSFTVGTNGGVLYDPVQVLPADPNRKSLHIDADGPVQIASDKAFPSAAVVTFPWTDTTHTGAVWLYSTSGSVVTVSVWAVTS